MSEGVRRIAAERQRQIESEGWTPEHDDEHDNEEMARAAAVYAQPQHMRKPVRWDLASKVPIAWPWAPEWFKPGARIRELEKAGALIAAEIDRLLRAEAAGGDR